jgi:hypothetical protein
VFVIIFTTINGFLFDKKGFFLFYLLHFGIIHQHPIRFHLIEFYTITDKEIEFFCEHFPLDSAHMQHLTWIDPNFKKI